MPFPDTGPYREHFGMFVGEVHEDPETMVYFTENLRLLSSKVDVILLEIYPKGQSPRLKFAEAIAGDLAKFNKGFGNAEEIAKNIYRLWSMAYYFGIDVQGIDEEPAVKKEGFNYLAERLSDAVNQGYLNCVDEYAKAKGKQSVRFCMYGGVVHWIKIRKLAQQLPGYRINQTGDGFNPLPR